MGANRTPYWQQNRDHFGRSAKRRRALPGQDQTRYVKPWPGVPNEDKRYAEPKK